MSPEHQAKRQLAVSDIEKCGVWSLVLTLAYALLAIYNILQIKKNIFINKTNKLQKIHILNILSPSLWDNSISRKKNEITRTLLEEDKIL
jgi:hypothetical protein